MGGEEGEDVDFLEWVEGVEEGGAGVETEDEVETEEESEVVEVMEEVEEDRLSSCWEGWGGELERVWGGEVGGAGVVDDLSSPFV